MLRTKLLAATAWLAGLACLAPAESRAGYIVAGTSNPYLAGMPSGSTASGDSAPAQSPVEATGLTIAPGQSFSFSATGLVSYSPLDTPTGPDGNPGYVFGRDDENGLSGYTIAVNSLVGVFLGPDRPDLSPAPAALDFSTPASRDFPTLAPQLKQVFFIGDGLTSGGLTQTFVAPAGATRLFLGVADGTDWANNIGAFDVTVNSLAVPEPGTLLMSGFGALGLLGLARRRARSLTAGH